MLFRFDYFLTYGTFSYDSLYVYARHNLISVCVNKNMTFKVASSLTTLFDVGLYHICCNSREAAVLRTRWRNAP